MATQTNYTDLYYNSLTILLQIPPACKVVHEALFSGTNNPSTIVRAANNSGNLNPPPPPTRAPGPFFYDCYKKYDCGLRNPWEPSHRNAQEGEACFKMELSPVKPSGASGGGAQEGGALAAESRRWGLLRATRRSPSETCRGRKGG